MRDLSVSRDPEEAYQHAADAGLVVLTRDPPNAEMLPSGQLGVITPNSRFYGRNHFPLPAIDAATWRLSVGGLVEHPFSLSLHDVHCLPSQTLTVTLECAGNGRSQFRPPAQGEQWGLGAVGTAEWTGVPLAEVLARAGVKPSAREAVLRGADSGRPPALGTAIQFERSLSLGWAGNPDVLLAYAMNGEQLSPEHGYPLRVVVPGWYGMASVKWLVEIELVDSPFTGYYQADRYMFERSQNGQVTKEPATLQRVRALITEPALGKRVERGALAIRGVAWSGLAAIARVEVSIGGGPWQEARLIGEPLPYAWRRWELLTRLDRRGAVVIRARATDLAGQTQPERPEWNRLGYGSNAIQALSVEVV